MRDEIVKRIVDEAEYMIEYGATVRATAKVFHFSKSTVHKDVTDRLSQIDFDLYKKVKKVLNINLAERHVRGGNATKIKYEKLKKC